MGIGDAMTRTTAVLSCPGLDAKPRTEAQAKADRLARGTGTFINLWKGGPMGIEAIAHPSLEDALDDISSPGILATYSITLEHTATGWVEIHLAEEAREYIEHVNREWRAEHAHDARVPRQPEPPQNRASGNREAQTAQRIERDILNQLSFDPSKVNAPPPRQRGSDE